MAYCALADLQKARKNQVLLELTDVTSGSTPDAGIVAAAIAAADAEIEGYLSIRYPVPLTSTPALIKSISVILSLAWLYNRRDAMPESVKGEAERVRAILKEIAAGNIKIFELEDAVESDFYSSDYSERVFDPDTLLGEDDDLMAGSSDESWLAISGEDRD